MSESATATQPSLKERLESIRQPVTTDLAGIDNLIITELVSDIPLIQLITKHIIKSGGKRLRPLLVALSARATGYTGSDEHLELAAIIEFVHTATLLHDDVVDESNLRRGQDTANAVWGNQASVLVGDFLYSRAFQLLARRSHTAIMQVLSNTTNAIAEGEVLQLMNRHDAELSEAGYMDVINRKTAKLFESSAEIGAILGTDNLEQQQAMVQYGLNLGLAFQIIDDLLDYTASPETMGKNVGDDLAEGKMTLPLIYALQNTDEHHRQHIQTAIKQGLLEEYDVVMEAITQTNACDYCLQVARHHAELAKAGLEALPPSPYRQALYELIDFVVERNF